MRNELASITLLGNAKESKRQKKGSLGKIQKRKEVATFHDALRRHCSTTMGYADVTALQKNWQELFCCFHLVIFFIPAT